jgi:hypothetical protein
MVSQNKSQNNSKATPPQTKLFDYNQCNIELPDVPEGVISLVPVAFKFDEPGQRIIGAYMGNIVCCSEFDEDRTYLYHKVCLSSGQIVAFHGSCQLDTALQNLLPKKFEVDITFSDIEHLNKGKTLKQFQIVARAIPETIYPQLAPPAPLQPIASKVPF